MSATEQREDELLSAVQVELDRAVTKQVCDAVYETANLPPEQKTYEVLDQNCRSRKDDIMDVVLKSVNLQRLYFIIRSSVMGIITGALTFLFISYFGITNFWHLVFLGLVIFFVALFISRILDKPVIRISNLAILFLRKHRRLRNLVLDRL